MPGISPRRNFFSAPEGRSNAASRPIRKKPRPKITQPSRARFLKPLHSQAEVRLYLGGGARLATPSGVNSALGKVLGYLSRNNLLGLTKPLYSKAGHYAPCENMARFGEVPKAHMIKGRPLGQPEIGEANMQLLLHYGSFVPERALKQIFGPPGKPGRGIRRRSKWGDGGTEHTEFLG